MKMKIFLKRFFNNPIYLSILLLILLVCITHWRWIFLNEYFSSGDSAYFTWFVDTCRDVFIFPSIWFSLFGTGIGFGGPNFALSMYPSLYFMFAGLSTLFQNTIIASKLVYFIPIPMVSILGSFLLIQHLLKNRMAGIVGSIVYSYNVHALLLQTGSTQWAMAYALSPLFIFLFIKGIDNKKLNLSVLAGLIGFLACTYDFRIVYIVAWVMLFYIIYQILFKVKDKVYAQIIPILQYGFIPFIIIMLLNVFWILPFYFANTLSQSKILDRSIFGNQFFSFPQAIAFFYPFWTGGPPSIFHVQPIPSYFWLIPVFALLGLITNLKNKHIWFFAFIALLGITLAKQADHPFSHLYEWLMYHFPGFNAYREASKFYLLIALSYSMLIGGFIGWLWKNWRERRWQIYGKYLLTFLIVCIFFWNAKPLITGEIGKLFATSTMPNDYRILKDFLNNDHQLSTTLWVPHVSNKWGFFDKDHPRWALYNASMWYVEFRKNPAYLTHVYNTAKITPDLYWVLGLLDQPFTDNLLDITNTKYIIVPPQYKGDDDDMFTNTSINDRPFIINLLDHLTFIKRINIGTENMLVYENFNYKPLIYVTATKDDVYRAISYKSVDYKYISPSEYLIDIRNVNKPIYLNFNNAYASDWALDLGDKHYLLDKDHLQTNMQFNAFYINPVEITKNYDQKFYTKNADGGINLKLRLYYKSQDLVNIGTYFSLAVLISLLVYLFMSMFKIKDLLLRKFKISRKKQ
jgi:hypothetical protein